MLLKVKRLNYDAPTAYAPAQDAIINTGEIVSAVPSEARGSGPFLYVRFRDGSHMTIVGMPETLLAGNQSRIPRAEVEALIGEETNTLREQLLEKIGEWGGVAECRHRPQPQK